MYLKNLREYGNDYLMLEFFPQNLQFDLGLLRSSVAY